MPLDFPSAPSNGQTYTFNGIPYVYVDPPGYWRFQANTIPNASNTAYGVQVFANTADWLNKTANKSLEPSRLWEAANTRSLANVTGGGTINIDLNLGINFNVNITAPTQVLGNPTNVNFGQSGYISIAANSNTRVLTYGNRWKFSDNSPPTNSGNTTARDILFYSILPNGNAYGQLITNVPL